MSGVNKAILIGRLGKDPEVKTFENGTKKASFTLATSEYYKDKEGQRQKQTEWHNIVCWRNLADIAEKYLNKGKMIYLEGKIKNRSWEDNGIKKYITEIEVSTFTMLSSKNEEQGGRPTETKIEQLSAPSFEEEVSVNADDDLPF
ncbi:MAG: single-stranded DNA-binding protein [Bacteroidales bacterium]|jgi:single-strand DNA-binding protein|nr:single-stranded DNA-binding protein [Bacteroidales bacterium]